MDGQCHDRHSPDARDGVGQHDHAGPDGPDPHRDAGNGIATGQLQTFLVSLGPVPDVGSVVIPVTQTYDDGKVVEWKATPTQVAADKTLEPAPVLYVNDPSPATAAASGPSVTAASTSSDGSSAAVALGLSITALVVAAGGALLAAFALGRRRKSAA